MLGPGIGGGELLLIAVVALIVVGPKDLPLLMRKVGKAMGKARQMAAEFRASFDEMARQSELDELRKEVEALRSGQALDPLRVETEAAFRDLDNDLTGRPAVLRHYDSLGTDDVTSPDAAQDVPFPPPEPAPAAKPKRAPAKKVATAGAVAASAKTAPTKAAAKPASPKPAVTKTAVRKPAARKAPAKGTKT